MNFIRTLLLFLAVAPLTLNGQNTAIDSLKQKLAASKTEAERSKLNNAIASGYIENDPAQVKKYAIAAQNSAKKAELPLEEANAWVNLGNAGIMMSNYGEAFKNFVNAQGIFEEFIKTNTSKEVTNGLARTYGSIGVVCSEQNNYAKALEYYFKALKIYKETRQEHIVARAYNNIGIVYKALKDYDKALSYFNKALEIQKGIGDVTSAITLTNIGNIYLLKDKDAEAFKYYSEAEKPLIATSNQRGLGELYNNLGNYYDKTGNRDQAEANYNKALAVFNEIGEKYGASASLAFLGNLYAAKSNNIKALEYLEKSSTVAKEIGVMEQVRESEKSISALYEKTGNHAEALRHYKLYAAAKDSILNAENIKNLVREEMNFEMEQKAAIQKIETEKREAIYHEQSKKHTQQILFTALIVLLLAGLVFVVYNRLQLKKTLTLQRDLAEYEQKALHLQMNPHFVFNCLGSISSFIVQNGTDSAIKYLSKFSKLMRLTLEYSKESLIPVDKEIESLQNYLELEQLRFNNIFDFDITKDSNIEDDMAIPPLLLQPFVENAILHGVVPKKEKGHIAVHFSIENEKLVCTVTDDGIGFSKSKELKENSVTVHKSMALEITRKRLEVIQAFTAKTSHVAINELTADNGDVTGTRIILNLPIQYTAS
ncbi:MAG: tetratricopeptide repeat-containing sensor histidine kinase [Flavobacterium sp.]